MLTLANARLFDGHTMPGGRHSVTIDGTSIAGIDRAIGDGGEVIDVDGMALMPGLITSHYHPDFFRFQIADGMAGVQAGKELPPAVMMAKAGTYWVPSIYFVKHPIRTGLDEGHGCFRRIFDNVAEMLPIAQARRSRPAHSGRHEGDPGRRAAGDHAQAA